jgi:bacterial/archaeal transporter family-2 protein
MPARRSTTGHQRTSNRLLPAVLTVALGSLIAVQSRVNSELSVHGGTGLFPAWWTMTTGLALLTAFVVAHHPSRSGVGAVRRALRAGSLPWATLSGGLFGAIFLLTQSVTVPLVGVAVFSVGVVAGQTTGSLIVDRLGISASGVQHITRNRVVASVMAVVAVAIAISDRLSTTTGAVAYAVFAVVAGALIAPQQAANGRVAVKAGSPFVGAFVNFAGGALVLSAVLAVAVGVAGVHIDDPWGAPTWAYLGGVLGISIIAGAAWAVPLLGVLMFSLLSVFGQLTGALMLDLLAPTPGTTVSWHVIVGLAVTFAAILVAAAPRRGAYAD